jgi:(S)-ureidoglycine aminohydrolase
MKVPGEPRVNPFGHTRSCIAANYALITPDTHVWTTLTGWKGTTAAVHISPHLGARFSQATMAMDAEGSRGAAPAGVERFVYVLEGRLRLTLADASPHLLEPGAFAYVPPDRPHEFMAAAPSRLVLFEKPYESLAKAEPPEPIIGGASDIAGEPFMGDEDARLQTLLPADESFDMAMNIFTYQPGATLPQVEIHVMEHGLVMLDGAGIYRLGDAWHPVQGGDVIWMASYCPQWFVAMGKEPARYLYYKDINRHTVRP